MHGFPVGRAAGFAATGSHPASRAGAAHANERECARRFRLRARRGNVRRGRGGCPNLRPGRRARTACPAQIVRHCATHRRDSGRGRLQLGECLQPRLPSLFWRAAWRDACRCFSIATIFVWKSGEIGAPLPAIAGETLQLDARSRVRMPGAGSDRATNTRSIETGPLLTPRLAPTLRASCRGYRRRVRQRLTPVRAEAFSWRRRCARRRLSQMGYVAVGLLATID
jgi:hypothetical protein